MKRPITRRKFIKTIVALGAVTLLPIPKAITKTYHTGGVATKPPVLLTSESTWEVTGCILEGIREGMKIIAQQTGQTPDIVHMSPEVYNHLIEPNMVARENELRKRLAKYPSVQQVEFHIAIEDGLLLEPGDILRIGESK